MNETEGAAPPHRTPTPENEEHRLHTAALSDRQSTGCLGGGGWLTEAGPADRGFTCDRLLAQSRSISSRSRITSKGVRGDFMGMCGDTNMTRTRVNNPTPPPPPLWPLDMRARKGSRCRCAVLLRMQVPESGREVTSQSSRLRVSQWNVPGCGGQSKTGEPFQMRNQRADNEMQSVFLNGILDQRGRKDIAGTAEQGLWTGQQRTSADFLNWGPSAPVCGKSTL